MPMPKTPSTANLIAAFEEWYFHADTSDEGKERERDEWPYKSGLQSWEAGAKWASEEIKKLVMEGIANEKG